MVSPRLYRRCLLPWEAWLADRLAPYGIHHWANNLHLFADAYSEIPCSFVDVGWGSDVAKCGRTFRDAFLNLRLSPARILQESVEAIRYDAKQLLELSGRTTGVGLCCMNMDHGTPDPNVVVLIDVSGEMR
jgi:uncharacterized protein with von Willebrand factor type A (vWA) domain